MENNYVFVAEIFRNRRIELGYSKRKLASIVEISDTELSRIEHGERENYNLITLIKMCKALNINFIRLLVAAGYITPDLVMDAVSSSKEKHDNNQNTNEKDIVEFIITMEII